MSEFGGLDIGIPQEQSNAAPEQLSEEAQQRFAANAQALRELKKVEKKSRKKDDAIAAILKQFLSNSQYSHLVVLISRLSSRNCPSIFILAIVSLIDDSARTEVDAYIQEYFVESVNEALQNGLQLLPNGNVSSQMNAELIAWITRLQMTVSIDPDGIIRRLLIDTTNIDGALLQLSAFIIQEYYKTKQMNIEFTAVQPLAAQILQTILASYISAIQKKILQEQNASKHIDD
jgi:hypothetical protein